MTRRFGWLCVGVILLALWGWSQRAASPGAAEDATHAPATTTSSGSHAPLAQVPRDGIPDDRPSHDPRGARASPRIGGDTADGDIAAFPDEVRDTLRLIARGGPYPHRQDGVPFQNREGRLPAQPRGYYREFTVETPRSRDRGARRIVTGGDPPREYFYSDDHYRSFRRIDAGAWR